MIPAGRFCSNRAIEWQAAVAMVGVSAVLLFEPRTLETGAFRYILLIPFISQITLGLFAGFFGIFRLAALYLNGHLHPYGPALRFVTAGAGALIWSLMAFGLVCLWAVLGAPFSPGIPLFICVAIGEIYSCLRAGRDHHAYPSRASRLSHNRAADCAERARRAAIR